MAAKRYLVCYDICEPRRLREVAKAVQGYGTRLQYSVFECMLTPVQLTSLQSDLREIIEGDEDQVLFVSLAASDGRNENLIISSLGLPYTERAVLTII